MGAAPSLSICIPTYNLGEWTRGAVASALATRSGDEVEVVVVDDGSTDETRSVLEDFRGEPNLHLRFPDEHLGMVGNFNRVVSESRGKWVTVLGSDDELFPTYYENLRPHLEDQHSACVSQVAWIQLRDGEWAFGPQSPRDFDVREFVPTLGGAVCISTTAFRRHLFDLVGGFSPEVGSFFDFDLLFRMASATGLPIRALGMDGGRYYPLRGSTWTRHEEAGEANELILHWIELRRSELGTDLAALATQALAKRARAAGRAQLARQNRVGAARNFGVAARCTTGLERLENDAGALAARMPASALSLLARLYVFLRDQRQRMPERRSASR